jgi:hypothetical protein
MSRERLRLGQRARYLAERGIELKPLPVFTDSDRENLHIFARG